MKAVNLGEDTDTTAAICGQVAGAFYLIDGIPERWREQLTMSSKIEKIADNLFNYI